MNTNEIVLLNLLKKSLFNIDATFQTDIDWEAVKEEAAAQTVLALAEPAVPYSESKQWQVLAAQSTAHYMRVLFEQTNLLNLLTDNNIPPVILKGAAAAIYYPKPQLRTMGDIDFIVPESDFESAKKLLDENGYALYHNFENGREYSYIKGGVDIELHHRYSDLDYNIEPIIKEAIHKSVVHTLNGNTFPTLPDYENGLVILDHIRHHLVSGLGLRQIIDWTMFAVNNLTNKNYSEHFLPLIESVGLVRFCEVITKMCKMFLWLPETVTWCDNADEDTAAELMQIVMGKGNFGIKEIDKEKRPMRGLVFSIKKDGIFKTLQKMGLSNFKICQKSRLLRPFAWLFQIFRFVWRGFPSLFSGKKLINDIHCGNERVDFFKRLGL